MPNCKTVKDLIDELSKLPADALVFAGNHSMNNTDCDQGRVMVAVSRYNNYVFIAKDVTPKKK